MPPDEGNDLFKLCAPCFNPRVGNRFWFRVFTRVYHQHIADALCMLFRKQRIKSLTGAAKILVRAVAQGNHAVSQSRLIAKLVFDGLE